MLNWVRSFVECSHIEQCLVEFVTVEAEVAGLGWPVPLLPHHHRRRTDRERPLG